jgi:3',5'-cyclic AMP phosphodiesterase CpdA
MMLIAQISDTHILAETSDRPEAGSRAEDLRRCVADIGRFDPQPDAVIHTGDTVQTGAPAEYAHLHKLLSPLEPRVYPAPGNRDDRDNFRAAFGVGGAPFLHYAVDDLPVRLIALDSVEPPSPKGVFCPDRLRWLDETLAAAPARPTILFIHQPPFDLEPHYTNGYREPAERDALAAVVRRHRQVRRLMCGHCHRSSLLAWAGTEASSMASVACDVRKGVDAEHLADTPMYQLHAVSEDGAVTTQTRLVTE